MHKAIIYGKPREVYGVRMDGACLRLVLDGGGAYLYGVPREPAGPVRMAELPAKAEELEGGDIVTFADGKGYRVGGALVSWTPEDAAFAAAIRAEAEPPKTVPRKGNGGAGGREPQDPPEETAKAVRWVMQHSLAYGMKRACELAVTRYGLSVGWQALRRRVVPKNSPRK